MLDTRIKRLESKEKYHFGLFLLLKEIHNFSYTMTVVEGSRNIPFDNTTKLLDGNNFDISITGELQMPSKIDQVDFLMPFYKFKMCFFYRRPRKSTVDFVKPFSPYTWYGVIVWSIIFTIVLKIGLVQGNAENTFWATSIFITVSSLCQQDTSSFPSAIVCRLIYVNLLIVSILLFDYYTSIMVSLLLNSTPSIYHTVDELAHSNLDVGIDDQSFAKEWLESANFSDVRYLYSRKLIQNVNKKLNTYLPPQGMDHVGRGGFAYHTDTSTGYSIIGRNFDQNQICDLSQVQMIPSSVAGLTVPKNSHFFQMFQISLQKLRERGFIQRLSRIWEAEQAECYSFVPLEPVGMEQGLPAFNCLLAGTLMALLILFLEIVLHRFNRK
ncbi:hypothetical protein MTP99_008287 [Tenebrio molitor]|nr:hypothetical protein MTP99_008287 [Tenebrio molitor]